MSSSLSDEALLAGLAAGEADAAAAFVRRFQARVFGLVITIVRDQQVAEDVAQETFVRAWRHAATYDPRRGRVVTWLLAIARNLAIDITRLKGVVPLDPEVLASRLQRADSDPSLESPEHQDSPFDERERVRRAIAELPAEQRRALFLAAYAGRTAREISDLDDVPLGTVKTRIRTAMVKLHDSLESRNEV
jgi:RNA polymerase sigma factor (sigma-70 family)